MSMINYLDDFQIIHNQNTNNNIRILSTLGNLSARFLYTIGRYSFYLITSGIGRRAIYITTLYLSGYDVISYMGLIPTISLFWIL
jgi:hypothetical protein